MATCTCGHTAPDTAAFCEQCGSRLAAPVGVASGITTTAPAGLGAPGPRFGEAARAQVPATPAVPVFPGVRGTPLPSPFGDGTVLPHARATAAAAPPVSFAADRVIGLVACIGIVIGAFLDWSRHVSAQHIPAAFLYDLHTRSRDPKIAPVLFVLAACGVAASVIAGGRRWRVCIGAVGVVMSVAYFVQVWRVLTDVPGDPSYTDYVRFGPVVALVSAGVLMVSPAFGSGERTEVRRNRSLTTVIAMTVALAIAWFGFSSFTSADGRTLVAPTSAHFRARVHGTPHVTSRVQWVLGAKISTVTAVASTPGRFEEIAEDDMPAAVALHDAAHSASDQFAHVLMRNQMLLPVQIESSKPAQFQGKDALYEERASGPTKAFILYVFDGSRVYVIAAMSTNSSPKATYDALVSSFKITG